MPAIRASLSIYQAIPGAVESGLATMSRKIACQPQGGFAIVRLPAETGSDSQETLREIGVDGYEETPHNLASLLQRTQRFVMRSQQYRISSLTINSR